MSNSAQIQIEKELSNPFRTAKGVRHTRILLPLLFIIYREWIMRRATENWKWRVSIGGTTISILRYADDTTLMVGDEMEMAEFLRRMEEASIQSGLRFNRSKGCLMILDRAKIIPLPSPTANSWYRTMRWCYLYWSPYNKQRELRKRNKNEDWNCKRSSN